MKEKKVIVSQKIKNRAEKMGFTSYSPCFESRTGEEVLHLTVVAEDGIESCIDCAICSYRFRVTFNGAGPRYFLNLSQMLNGIKKWLRDNREPL
jgi:hypothetical protein